MAWANVAGAFAAFLLCHTLPVRPPLRPWLEAALGKRGFSAAYSALSLVLLVWLIVAAGRAPFVPLWDWAPWQSHAALTLMLAACLLFGLAIGRPNPFSFGGRGGKGFDPEAPGFIRLTRHPLIAVLAIWSGAHMLANGDLAHVILFGAFGVFALLGGRLIDQRRQRAGETEWSRLRSAVSAQPLFGAGWGGSAIRLGGGFALWFVLVLLHPYLIGVDPLP
jgi:uncharacterized membrane protein